MFNPNTLLYSSEINNSITLDNYSNRWFDGNRLDIQCLSFKEPQNVILNCASKIEKKRVKEIHKNFFKLRTASGFETIMMESNDILIQTMDMKKVLKEKYYLNTDLIIEKLNKGEEIYLTLQRPEFNSNVNINDPKIQSQNRDGAILAIFFSSLSKFSFSNPVIKIRFRRSLINYYLKGRFYDKFSFGDLIKKLYGPEVYNNLNTKFHEEVVLNGKKVLMKYALSEKDQKDLFLIDLDRMFFKIKNEYDENITFGGGKDDVFDMKMRNFLLNNFSYQTLKSFIHYLFLIEGENYDKEKPNVEYENHLFMKTINDIAFMVGYDSIYDKDMKIVAISEQSLSNVDKLISMELMTEEELLELGEEFIDFQTLERKVLMDQFIILNDYRK